MRSPVTTVQTIGEPRTTLAPGHRQRKELDHKCVSLGRVATGEISSETYSTLSGQCAYKAICTVGVPSDELDTERVLHKGMLSAIACQPHACLNDDGPVRGKRFAEPKSRRTPGITKHESRGRRALTLQIGRVNCTPFEAWPFT